MITSQTHFFHLVFTFYILVLWSYIFILNICQTCASLWDGSLKAAAAAATAAHMGGGRYNTAAVAHSPLATIFPFLIGWVEVEKGVGQRR